MIKRIARDKERENKRIESESRREGKRDYSVVSRSAGQGVSGHLNSGPTSTSYPKSEKPEAMTLAPLS